MNHPNGIVSYYLPAALRRAEYDMRMAKKMTELGMRKAAVNECARIKIEAEARAAQVSGLTSAAKIPGSLSAPKS